MKDKLCESTGYENAVETAVHEVSAVEGGLVGINLPCWNVKLFLKNALVVPAIGAATSGRRGQGEENGIILWSPGTNFILWI